MTITEWHKFKLWLNSQKKPASGYIIVYPSAIKFISNPSDFMRESADKYGEICFFPESSFKLEGDSLLAKSQKFTGIEVTPKIKVPFSYIKKLCIYGYNR